MADVITRFKLETTQYDSKLRDAAKGLREFTNKAQLGGKNFTDFSQKAVESARALGTVASGAMNTKEKVRDLVGAYNEAARAYNSLSEAQQQHDFGKNLAASLETLKGRITEAKQELYGMNEAVEEAGKKSSSLFGEGGLTGMLQVFGGNMLTKGVSMLTSELAGSVQEGIELAKQGEGIRMAFERLNKPGLLDELKAATHGTVSEIELMQQAIKFENFKLPVEDLANYLAFAQQKAKDTGESIDYLVNSIVTGLGRQSKQILDNLGISAAELTKRMNEGATMTQAVSDIIREEMAKAGDYVETAADRAARATADTKNKMEELGRSAMPVAEEFTTAWNEIKNGAMTIVLPVLKTLADSIRDIREILGGEWDMPKPKPGIQNLADGPANSNRPKRPTWGDVPVVTAPGGYVEVTDKSGNVLHGGHYDSDAQLQKMMKRWNTLKGATGGRGGGGNQKVSIPTFDDFQKQIAKVDVEKLKPEDVVASPSVWKEYADGIRKSFNIAPKDFTVTVETSEALDKLRDIEGVKIDPKGFTVTAETSEALDKLRDIEGINIAPKVFDDDTIQTFDGIKDSMDRLIITSESYKKAQEDIAKEEAARITRQKQLKEAQELGAQAAINFGSALESMEDPAAKAAGTVMQAIASIALGFAQASATASELGPFGWVAFLAAGAAAMATTISTVHSLTGYAQGGVIKGNSYSGDNIGGMVDGGGFVGLNAGEVVLNAAQQRGVASALNEGGNRRIEVFGRLSGETIYLSSDRYTRRTGRGTIMTWK